MATPEWNSIDNYTMDEKDYYCAFLDILGYKEKSEMYFGGMYNLHGRFKRALTQSLSIIEISSILINVNDLDVKFFSDSVIISLPKEDSNRDSLFGMLFFCRVLSAHLSYEGLYLRGGLSFGPHMDEIDEEYGFSFLSSIALQKAYILESKKAIYPRILIDPSVVPLLTRDAQTLIAKDHDEYFIHFSPQLINLNGENADIVLLEMEDIYKLRMELKEQKVIDKYTWILDYYYWTLTQSKNIDIEKFSKFETTKFKSFSSY
ncbi:hypothetical protein [Halomonas sp. Y3]|uniref:hypothetical protein n=1 Tax=Halomonas sp. Y3 TaxID=2956797 RepID=UPI00209E18ED|nr:hypothetical protein [Halomonas sp. Y3]